MPDKLRKHGGALALLTVLLLAGWLRLGGIGFGLPALNDPDELIFELGAMKMLRGGTLNPGWFGHPATTTMYALAIVNVCAYLFSHAVGWVADVKQFADGIYADPGWLILPGRMLMLGFGLLCILLTARLGTRMFDRTTGLAAALLLAVNPVHILYSQIIRSDMMACAFMLLCLNAAIGVARTGGRRDYLKASLWLGIAIATKWPFAATGIAVAGAALLHLINHPATRAATIRNLILFAIVALATLFIVSPFLLIDWRTVIDNLGGEAQLRHLGASGTSPIANAWWYLRVPLRAAFGICGLLLAGVGLIWFAIRHREVRFVLLPLLLAFLLLITSQNLVWERWILPLMAPLSILAGAALVTIARAIHARWGQFPALLATALVAAITLGPLLADARAHAREKSDDTRQVASRWAVRSIPAGSTVLLEHFAFDLVRQPWHFLFPAGLAGCIDARGLITGKIDYARIDGMRGGRSNLDYGTVVSGRDAGCGADYAILTQVDRYAAERATFGPEYENYRRLMAAGTQVAVFHPEPGRRGGPIVRIIRFDRGQAGDRDR